MCKVRGRDPAVTGQSEDERREPLSCIRKSQVLFPIFIFTPQSGCARTLPNVLCLVLVQKFSKSGRHQLDFIYFVLELMPSIEKI